MRSEFVSRTCGSVRSSRLVLFHPTRQKECSVKNVWFFRHGCDKSRYFMISNLRPSPFNRRPFNSQTSADYYPSKPHIPEDTLASAEVQIERKMFVFTLKENERGRLLRITEDAGTWAGFRVSVDEPIFALKRESYAGNFKRNTSVIFISRKYKLRLESAFCCGHK